MNIEITESAANRVKELIAKDSKNMIALRISVDGGGCSGFMYQYKLVDAINYDDYTLESHEIKIAIDPTSQQFLNGCKVEFIQELGSNFFKITNPKATAKCGCGNSFDI